MKSSTPASRAIVAAVRGLSPVIITVRMPIRRNSANRSTRPSLTVSLSSITPSTRPSRSRTSGVAPRSAIRSAVGDHSVGQAADLSSRSRRRRPSGWSSPSSVRTPLVRVSARNGISSTIVALERRRSPAASSTPAAAAELCRGACERGRRSSGPPGSRPGSRTTQRRRRGVRLGDARRRRDRRGEAVAVGDRARLVEEDDVDVAGRLDGAAAHREDVEPRDAVHARRCRWPTAGRRSSSG